MKEWKRYYDDNHEKVVVSMVGTGWVSYGLPLLELNVIYMGKTFMSRHNELRVEPKVQGVMWGLSWVHN
jgi:hypothetical protein